MEKRTLVLVYYYYYHYLLICLSKQTSCFFQIILSQATISVNLSHANIFRIVLNIRRLWTQDNSHFSRLICGNWTLNVFFIFFAYFHWKKSSPIFSTIGYYVLHWQPLIMINCSFILHFTVCVVLLAFSRLVEVAISVIR